MTSFMRANLITNYTIKTFKGYLLDMMFNDDTKIHFDIYLCK